MSDARPSILIADDTPANLELLGYLLGADYQIFLAVTGQEAVERALAHRPDLILMDVLMPGMDGFEACRRIKADARTADIPVIFVTAIDRVAEETRGLELGAIDFISKPFSPQMAGLFQRPGDLVARYGGEEFVGVLAETDPAGASRVADSPRWCR